MYGMHEELGGDEWNQEESQVGEVDNSRSYAQFDRGSAAGRMLYNLYNRGKGVEKIYRPNVRLKQKSSGLTPQQEHELKIRKKAEAGIYLLLLAHTLFGLLRSIIVLDFQ